MAFNTQNATLKMTAGFPRQFPKNPLPQVAMSGRSNVGKSSLINSLLTRKSLARVSGEPGKTVTVNFYDVDGKLFLVDLPGYGYAKRSPAEKKQWSELTDGYFTQNPNIDLLCLVIQLVDSRVGPTKDDITMLRFMNENAIPYVVVATKVDKLNKTNRDKCIENLHTHEDIKTEHIILYSVPKSEGKSELWSVIKTYANIK